MNTNTATRTARLAAKTGPKASQAEWRDALRRLAAGELDTVTTSGALRAERIADGRVPSTLGELHGTEWGTAIDAVRPRVVVTSYATPIAFLVGDTWFAPAVKYSTTTSGHQSKVNTATNAVKLTNPDTLRGLVGSSPTAETARTLVGDGMDADAAVRAAELLVGGAR
jgi:hypothetical protein